MTLPSTQEPLLPAQRLAAGPSAVPVRDVQVQVTVKQQQVLDAPPHVRNIIYEGGMGSGKTSAGAHWLVSRSALNSAAVEGLMVSPSYPNMQQAVLPRIDEVFRTWGIDYGLNWGKKQLVWESGGERRVIWLRSAERAHQISGGNVGFLWMDEPALCSAEAYKRARTRVRDKAAAVRQRLYTGTHEGTRTWFYRLAQRAQQRPDMLLVHATTFDNPWLGEEFYDDILETYEGDAAGLEQYVLGKARDAQGGIYTKLTDANVARCISPLHGQVCVGWDFNVGWMVTVLGTFFPGQQPVLHLWGEVVSKGEVFVEDHAEKVVRALEQAGVRRRWRGQNASILYNPNTGEQVEAHIDASGFRRQTLGNAAAKSDAAVVEAAGFNIRSDRANPYVRNRIAAMQRGFKKRRILIDPEGAPETLQAFKEHSRDKWGNPQKEWSKGDFQLDHYCDAGGYLGFGKMPLYPGSQFARNAAPNRSSRGIAAGLRR